MTSTGPTVRTTARSARGPVLLIAALVLAGTVAALVSGSGAGGTLDPRSFTPQGAHALAALLADRGVAVHRLELPASASSAADSTVLVPVADLVSPADLAGLARLPGRLVVVGATGERLRALGVATTDAAPVEVAPRAAACTLPLAVRAGDAELGGVTYRATGAADCYASAGRPTLLEVGRVTLLGSAALLTNDRLAHRGNAALALGLLGRGRQVQWLMLRPGTSTAAPAKHLGDLVPTWLKLAVVQLLVAVGVLALVRARRLGPVVVEPLPVVVRAAEAVEGRSRLYQLARARTTAAQGLRSGARDRVGRRLGLGPESGPEAVVGAVAARTGRPPADLEALLYGAAPTDDHALVQLADELDALTAEVAGT